MTAPTAAAPGAQPSAEAVVDVGVLALTGQSVDEVDAWVATLEERLRATCPAVGWRVTQVDPGPREARSSTELGALLSLGRRRLLDSDLDVVVVLSDRPAELRRRRLRAHASPVQQTTFLQVVGSPEETVAEAVGLVLAAVGLDDDRDDADVLRQLAAGGDRRTAPGRVLLGRARLLLTLVAQSRPWLMTVHLSKTLTGAFAASLLAVVTPDFWLLADRMSAARLVLVTVAVLAVLCGVLVIGGGLQERVGANRVRHTVLVHNAAVWISVAIGVVTLYVGLVVVDLAVSVVVLPHRLLAQTLGHPASWGSVLRVGALTSTVALVGSVFGASLEDDDDVHEAAYTGSDDARYANG